MDYDAQYEKIYRYCYFKLGHRQLAGRRPIRESPSRQEVMGILSFFEKSA